MRFFIRKEIKEMKINSIPVHTTKKLSANILKKKVDNKNKTNFICLHTKEKNKITLIPLQIKKHTGGRVNSTGKCQVPPSVVKCQQSDHDLRPIGETTPTLGTQAGLRVLGFVYRVISSKWEHNSFLIINQMVITRYKKQTNIFVFDLSKLIYQGIL